EATPDKNRLSTDTLTYSDIENHADYSASSVGVNLDTRKNAEKKDAGLTPNIGVKVSGDADSTTQSAIAPGTIEIRSNPNQDISNLSRNADQALNALGKIFDKKTVQEKQELARVFGEEVFKAIGDLAAKEYTKACADAVKAQNDHNDAAYRDAMQRKDAWDIGGVNEVMLHTLAGGIMSDLGGSGFASGAAGAGIGELVEGRIKELSPELQKMGSVLVGAVAAKIVGGNAQAGASTSLSGTINNGLIHEQQLDFANDMLYAINTGSTTQIIWALSKYTAKDWANLGEGESGENETIYLLNAAAQVTGSSFSYNQNDSLHHNIQAFWGALVDSVPSVDPSTLISAGVVGTAVVVAGVALYNYNGNWVKATGIIGAATPKIVDGVEYQLIGNNPAAKYSGNVLTRINTDMTGGLAAAEKIFSNAAKDTQVMQNEAGTLKWIVDSAGNRIMQLRVTDGKVNLDVWKNGVYEDIHFTP
ncbi:hypothetical protein SAMN04490178_1552, partial [Propionispora vibrioides]